MAEYKESARQLTLWNQQNSLILRLPGEVRNMIYKYTLTKPNGLFYTQKPNERSSGRQQYGVAFPLYMSRSDRFDGEQSKRTTSQRLLSRAMLNPFEGEFHQLKFTCSQLRQETKGLGLEWNRVTFLGLR